MLKWIRDTTRKSRAAVVMQNLFDSMPVPFTIPGGPAKFANALVGLAWDMNPSAFNGKRGPAPHHMAVAAVALANGVEVYKERPLTGAICRGALGIILEELLGNRLQYSLNGTDFTFLDLAQQVLLADDEQHGHEVAVPDPQLATYLRSPILTLDPATPIDPELSARNMELQARLSAFKR